MQIFNIDIIHSMKARDLKEKFINFFIAQKHIEIPSANLTPENDPTTLFYFRRHASPRSLSFRPASSAW